MTYSLLIADRSYSSWSLRGWLPFAAFDIPVEVSVTRLYDDRFARDVAEFAPGRTVPVVRTPEGGLLTDSMAIAWYLAEAFPDRGLLPDAPAARARALSLISEMHAGFTALRGACPMNLRTGWVGFEPSDAVRTDLKRLETIWSEALVAHSGPWLCGAYSLADVVFAPVATRIVTYDLPVSDQARAYVVHHLSHPAFRSWYEAGFTDGPEQSHYEMNLPRCPFPMPA
ncbi:glutathione S-transferase [Rhodophyticola sp. CCM32]|uniref:glutathione S-transferase n=1 Tax=Rhodophyticola sp. CCM32 TaxID=2916397 RepID=UPI00107F585F|nr:glutathione S-transferase [Rhodophyticola sp. CCM32]QBX99624.1 glutathione S-transferase [Rhodophyticola sp. CCM32]